MQEYHHRKQEIQVGCSFLCATESEDKHEAVAEDFLMVTEYLQHHM